MIWRSYISSVIGRVINMCFYFLLLFKSQTFEYYFSYDFFSFIMVLISVHNLYHVLNYILKKILKNVFYDILNFD